VSGAEECETPFGPMKVDAEICRELVATGHFSIMDQDTDETEHSLEMHMPYIKHRMADHVRNFPSKKLFCF